MHRAISRSSYRGAFVAPVKIFRPLVAPVVRRRYVTMERSLWLKGSHSKRFTGLETRWLSSAVRAPGPEKKEKEEEMQHVKGPTRRVWDDALTIPNALTMTRIAATPWICHLIWTEDYKLAIGMFWVAGFFDWLDGYLARKWNQQTILGSFLDPLADKLFVAGTLLTLTAKGSIPIPLCCLIVGRDLLLVGGSFYIRAKTRPQGAAFFEMGKSAGVVSVEASMVSKFNTLFQFGIVWFTMTHLAFDLPPAWVLPYMHGLVYASTFLSGFDYLYRNNQRNIFGKK